MWYNISGFDEATCTIFVLSQNGVGAEPTIGKVARRFDVSKSKARRVMLKLEKRGLVVRDRRAYKAVGADYWRLTESGITFAKKARIGMIVEVERIPAL